MGNEIKFKPATFYLGVVDHLAKAVEGLKPEDIGAEGGEGAKRGHGEILDDVTQGTAQEGETKLASRVGEVVTAEVHPTNDPSRGPSMKGKGRDASLVFQSSSSTEHGVTLNHDDETVTGMSLHTTLDVSTSTSTHKPDSHTYPPQQQSQESELNNPRSIPTRETTKPYNDER